MAPMALAALVGVLAAHVTAHGFVQQIKIGNNYFPGYNPTVYTYETNPPKVAGWTAADTDMGFVSPSSYTEPDIICHKNATPGQTHIAVNAGQQVTLLWTPWPQGHQGPVITYMAKCLGTCETADKTALNFFKVDQLGLVTQGEPGTWATDNLVNANSTWTFTVPSSIAAGNYVVRHEIIALHQGGQLNGAQNYPFCINFAVSGSGTANPAGTKGEALYTPTDPGILDNIYKDNTNYTIPGPALYTGKRRRSEFEA